MGSPSRLMSPANSPSREAPAAGAAPQAWGVMTREAVGGIASGPCGASGHAFRQEAGDREGMPDFCLPQGVRLANLNWPLGESPRWWRLTLLRTTRISHEHNPETR